MTFSPFWKKSSLILLEKLFKKKKNLKPLSPRGEKTVIFSLF